MTTLAAELFTATSASAWPAQWTRSGGAAAVTAEQGSMTPAAGAYVSMGEVLTGMTATVDTVLTCDFQLVSPLAEQYLGISVRADQLRNNSAVRPTNGYLLQIASTDDIEVVRVVAGTPTTLGTVSWSPAGGSRWSVELSAIGAVISATVWPAGTAKPGTPSWTGTDPSPYSTAGKVLLAASNGATGSGIALWGPVTVTNGASAPPSHGTASGTWTMAAAAAGSHRSAGVAAGGITWTAAAAGHTSPHGSTAGTVEWAATAAGHAPAIAMHHGTATGTWHIVGSAHGSNGTRRDISIQVTTGTDRWSVTPGLDRWAITTQEQP